MGRCLRKPSHGRCESKHSNFRGVFTAGRLADVRFEVRVQSLLHAMTEDVVYAKAIKSEICAPVSVSSSIAKRLDIDQAATAPADRDLDSVVDMMLDAVNCAHEPLNAEKFFG